MRIRGLIAATVCLAAITATGAVPAAAASDDPVRWGNVAGWDVMIDPTLGNGCFIYTIYDAGTELRLGFSPDDAEAYLMVGNPKWASIEEGKDYDVQFKMDRDTPWYATATGVNVDGLPLLMATTDKPNFLIDFAKKKNLQVVYQSQTVASLSLSGTFAAISEMTKCQTQVDKFGIPGRSKDPFASRAPTTNTGDPFRR
jgi:hypothetical protein